MQIITKCENPYITSWGGRYACGQCPSCRKTQNREWAIRAMHENMFQEKAVFVTLSYSNTYLHRTAKNPMNEKDKLGSLDKRDLQLFWKRLRKKYKDRKIRYIACGEYGPKTWRPHYHAIVWGIDITDINNADNRKKNDIAKIWGLGHVWVDLKPISNYCIQYVLGYIRKKAVEQNNKTNKKLYELNGRQEPFRTQSQGIGKDYVDYYKEELAETLAVSYNEKNLQHTKILH